MGREEGEEETEDERKSHLEATKWGPEAEAHERDLRAFASVSVRFPSLQSVARCLVVGWGHCWSAGLLIGKTKG